MADPVGFKPTRPNGLPDFKSGAFDHSATGLLRLHWVASSGGFAL